MRIRLYQINPDRDEKGVAFEPLERLQRTGSVDARIYDLMYDGNVQADSLEDVYRIFNIEKPDDFTGRSTSVSDVIEVLEPGEEGGFYYCDSIGYKKVEFESGLCRNPKDQEGITVVMCEPGREGRVAVIPATLESYQEAVGGDIEPFYAFGGPCCIVCCEDGKINGMLPNRAVYGEGGELMDIIFGTFFICGIGEEDFESLSGEEQAEYLERFRYPERFFREGGMVKAVPYKPQN